MRTAHSHGDVVLEEECTEGMNTVDMARVPEFGNPFWQSNGLTEEMVTNCMDKRSSSRALKKGGWTG